MLLAAGCAKSPPVVTDVEGTLLLNDQPLANAQVQFMPELTGFGAEMNSTAITDDKGQFHLTTGRGDAGAVVGKHRVVVTEAPLPPSMRGQDQQSQEKMSAYLAKLKNRPIPTGYGSYSQTPLFVEVTAAIECRLQGCPKAGAGVRVEISDDRS